MKRIISLAFLLFSITLFSQSEKVNFENELVYKLGDYSISWYASNKYPNLNLVMDLYNGSFLYYSGNASYYSLNENNEIEYDKLNFSNETINKTAEITKSEIIEVINGLKCEKFIVNLDGELQEVFISNDLKINNTDYYSRLVGINSIVGINDNPIKSGFIVKINVYKRWYDKYETQLELSEIKKSNKYIFIDFREMNLRLNEPQKYPMIKSDVVEPVEVIIREE